MKEEGRRLDFLRSREEGATKQWIFRGLIHHFHAVVFSFLFSFQIVFKLDAGAKKRFPSKNFLTGITNINSFLSFLAFERGFLRIHRGKRTNRKKKKEKPRGIIKTIIEKKGIKTSLVSKGLKTTKEKEGATREITKFRMSSPHEEEDLAQVSTGVESPNSLTQMNPFNHDEDLVSVQVKSKKGRKHSRGQEKTKYQENTTERRGRAAERRGRSKSRQENEKADEGRTEEGGEPSKSCVVSSQGTSHEDSLPSSLPAPSRRLTRSRSAVSNLRRKTKEMSKNDEGRQRDLPKMIDQTTLRPTPAPGMDKDMMASNKAKWIGCRQKATSLWRKIRRSAKIVCVDAISVLNFLIIYPVKYLLIFLVLILLVSTTHRTMCELSLMKYYHPPCTTVWTSTALSTDPQQEHALSQLTESMKRHSEFFNQLRNNEYFQMLPRALFQSSHWMQHMRIVLQVTSLDIPSREQTVNALGEYVESSEEMGDNLSELWADIVMTVDLVLWERQGLVNDMSKIQSKPGDGMSALSSILEIPGLLWSFVATPLLGRSILTPYQTRQVNEEQARVALLTAFFPRLNGWLAKLAKDIESAQEDFKTLNRTVYKIQSFLLLDISKVSFSRDLLSHAESHPLQRFEALVGLRLSQRFDLRTRDAQLELLSSTNATVTITIRELVFISDVVSKLRNDLKSMTDILNSYEMGLADGRLSVDGLLRAVKVGVDALARGRVEFLEREKRRNVARRKEFREFMAQGRMEVRNVMDQFHELVRKQVGER